MFSKGVKKHDKNNVIQIGEKLFRTQGYHKTGTEDILNQSDYPRSSFYYHFKSKEGFAAEVLDWYGDGASRFYASVLQDKELGSPLERIKALSNEVGTSLVKSGFESQCLIHKMTTECGASNEHIRRKTADQMNKLLDILSGCIAEGQTEGEIRNDMTPRELAGLVHAQYYGGSVLSRLQKEIDTFRRNIEMVINYISAK
ncbi:MAG: TetR/AcrR family transcriptional regulator [Bacteroidia bacterium]|nr:TetR/AcrR family transcriptional regulator [Bacteroidia bacterium]